MALPRGLLDDSGGLVPLAFFAGHRSEVAQHGRLSTRCAFLVHKSSRCHRRIFFFWLEKLLTLCPLLTMGGPAMAGAVAPIARRAPSSSGPTIADRMKAPKMPW